MPGAFNRKIIVQIPAYRDEHTRGLISSEQKFVDNSKPGICKTVDIHSEAPRHPGAAEMTADFSFGVEKINGQFKVVDPPLYFP